MIDNQAAPQSEGGILDINRRVVSAMAPSSGGVLGQLRALGVDPASLTRRPDVPMTDAQRNDMLWQNATGMYGEMLDAVIEGRWSDVSPSQVGSAMVQAGATKLLGQTAGAAIGGVYDELQALADFPMQSRNWFARMATGRSLPELADAAFGGTAPLPIRMLASRGASSDALLDDKFIARSRTVDPMASRSEMAAAIGEYDPMSAPGIAGALSSAMTQVGTAIALSSIPGGQVAGAARASSAIGRVLAPAKALLGNPGGRAYLAYAGGRQAINRSADYLRFNEMDRNATSQYNAAIDRLGLGDVLDKQEVPEYSRMTDLGVSLASGAMTAFSEMIGTGFSVAAGKRIIGRLYGGFTPKAAEGGMREMLKASAKGFFASGSMEGLEEVVDGYGQAIIGGLYDWTEEGGFAWAEKTGGSFDPLTVFKKHAPELFYDFAIAFAVSAPLGAGGGLASVTRRRNWHDAFTKALMRDQIAVDETGATRGESDFLAAQAIAQAMAGGDPSILPSVLEHLRKTMPEIGQVTESQLRDPAWVAQFVRNFPLMAVRLSEMEGLSRTQSEWLTGTAARGRVPGADARGQFLELVRAELRNMIPAYMQGWYERSATELEAYNRQLQELGDKTDDRSRLLRAQAKSRIKFILDIRKQIRLAWINKETIDQSTFESWLRFDEAADGIDTDGTADAKETTPSTARSDAPGTDEIRARARAGDAEAAFTLAQMHESGQGAEKHFYKSQYWMSVALANSGDVEAMVYLGRMYAGRAGAYPPMAGAPRSINKARAWLRKAYELGSDEAGRLLADLETASPARPRPGRIDAAEAAQAARRTQAAPAASVAQPAPATPQEVPAAPVASPAVSEAPSVAPVARQPESAPVEADPAADTRRAVEARVAVEQRMQAEERAEAERRAADEADAPRREIERQVQQGAEDPDLRVRFVEAATPVEEKIAKAAGKLGKRVQFIRIFRDEAREGARRRRTPSGIRGFVGSDANTIYLVQVPNVMREQATTAYYLQTLAHENAHGVIRESDAETLKRVDALAGRALIAEFERRFDLGEGAERVEEIRVQTLTTGVVDAAGLDAILLADTAVEKTIARLKLLFNGLKIALTGNERAALLKRLTQEQVARAKAAKETKPVAKPLARPTPAPAAAEPAATRAAKPEPAAKPKPATQPTDDLARLIKDGQWVIGVTLEQGDQIEVVADGETVVLDSTSKAKGIDLRIIGKKLYLLRGSTTAVVTSAKVLTKPSVGKAKPKAAQPQAAQATAESAPKIDPANEPVASELPKPRRGRGKKGDGQQAMFMREIDPDIDTLPSIKVAGQSIREALLSTPKNHPYRDIAVAIAELPIPAMSEDRVGNERSKTDNFYSYDAAFEGQPRINLSMYTKYSTLIHEAVHAFTAESVKRSMLFALGRRDLAAAEGVDPSSLNGDAVSIARRLAKAKLIEPWELDGLLKERSEDERQSLLKMALLKRYVVDIKGDANIRTHDGYMAMVDAAIADPKTSVPVKRLLKLFRRTWAEIGEVGATATPNNRLMSPSGWDTIDTGNGQSEAEARRLRESLDIAYGLSNPLEFTAMAFSSPPFQRWLNERDGDGRKSLWEQFVAIISRILGVKNDSMLESVIEASADLSDVRPDSVAFMRERNSPKARQRIAELVGSIDLFDERSFGTLSHPTDKEDVDAEGIIADLLKYSAKVPRKYLKGAEEFEYLAAAIHHVLIEKSADSTDYERAAAVMSRALDEGIADYDQIVVAARRMGFEGTDKTVPFDIVSEEDVDPLRLNELMDDPDGFGGDIRFMRERTDEESVAVDLRSKAASLRLRMFGANPELRSELSEQIESIKKEFEDRVGVPWDTRLPYEIELENDNSQYRAEQEMQRERDAERRRRQVQSAAEAHRKAHERGDAKAARRLVDRAAKASGYIVAAKHGTDAEFTAFEAGEFGFHFGDAAAAEQRGDAKDFYLRIENPMRVRDMGYFDPMSFLGISNPEAKRAREKTARLRERYADDLESTDPFVQRRAEYLVAAPAREYLKQQGYDGLVYRNEAEGFGDSYVAFDANQIKSADPFTYDSNGELVPLDKRFDESTDDIRFMREKPTVASIKRTLSNIAPGSEFANNLATSFVWEYAILDREINRVAKEFGLEDEYRANDMLKVSPGKRAAAMLDFMNREVRPFEAAAEGLAKRTGMPVDLVLDKIKEYAFYVQSQDASKVLQAKVGESRGTVLKRAERLAAESGMSEDLALVEVWENMTSLGLTPEDAADGQARLEREFASDPMWMELVDRLRAMNRRTLELKREAGLITEESYQKLRSRYPNFVPVVRSIYDRDVDVDGSTYLPKNIKKRATRTMRGGQIVEESKLRSFWGASLAITQLDRNSAINQAARNAADNVLFLLSNRVDLETGDPIVGVSEDGEAIGLQTRSGQALLEPVYVDEEVRKTITRATVRAKTPRREDESVEEYRKRIDREVAYAQGQAMADMRTRLNNEASGEKPTLRRFKLDRDLDLTPPEIYEQAEQIMSSEDGLSDAERENNAKLEKRIAAERARLKSPEFAERVAEIEREIASLEASRRPGIDSTGIDARIDMLQKEKLLPKRRIASARSRMVRARNAEQREEARKSLLEQKQRLFKKGEIMYYRINDPTLASAMLVMRKTPLERMAESPLAVARMVAKGWFGLMSIMRFAYVQASVGFLVGEMQRSPQQLTIMARILAAEYELDADTADKFISGLAGKVGGGAAFMPATAVFGAIKALPFNKASKSIRRIMRGETPSNDYERMVRQAIEDGILQGQLYSVDNFDLARKRVVADMKRLETGDVGGVLGNAKKATRFVGETLDLTLTAIDMVNRMHVYTAAVEAGISRQTATVMARESLVDFAKKGTAARGIGQVLLFFSPRMQGIHQLTRSFAMLRSTGTRLAVRALAAKFLWSFVSSMVRELFYEDDEDASTMISKFAAERNLIIPAWMDSETGQWSWVQITEPYGFGAVSRAGTAVADMLVGDVSPVKTLATVAGAFASEAMPITVYDPTSLQSWFQAAVPTPVSPLLDLAFNTDYKGSPIAPLGAQFGAGDPRTSEQYFADTPSYYIKAAALMSAITAPIGRALGGGGSRGIEVSPNQIEYLLGRFLPGVVNDAARMIEVGSDYAGGSAISINEVPVLSKVVGESGGRRVLPGQFRDIDAIFERIRTDLKYESPAEVLGGASPLERWLASNQFWPSARRAIKGLQQQRNEMLRAGNRVAARRIEERMNMLRERAVNQALRIQNLESGPGFDTRVGRYFRGGDQ